MSERRRHQQATGQTPLGIGTRLWMALAAPLLRGLARLLIASCRVVRVDGTEHLDTLIQSGQPALLCCWHQRLAYCVAYLLAHRQHGLQPGFLVSPSRDGELMARIAAGLGARVLRGSATRTGARALREMYTVMRDGTSPVIQPDGPHGPPRVAKSGSLLLAQMTGAPLLPLSFAADRYWQLGSWDRLIIPKPFARVILCIGPPMTVTRGDDIDARATALADQLSALDERADQGINQAV